MVLSSNEVPSIISPSNVIVHKYSSTFCVSGVFIQFKIKCPRLQPNKEVSFALFPRYYSCLSDKMMTMVSDIVFLLHSFVKIYLICGSGNQNSGIEILLSLTGDLCWMGECVVDENDLPLRYPFDEATEFLHNIEATELQFLLSSCMVLHCV